VGVVAWSWQSSRLPDSYSVMDMGVVDLGGGPPVDLSGHAAHGGHGAGTSLVALRGPVADEPDVAFTLQARQGPLELATGEQLEGYTLNGTSPGPELRATQGDLIEVTLHNVDVEAGTTLHWHGVDLPNAEDGVAGVTQDAVRPGERYVYRFVAEDAGTYWYHSHQVSHEQVRAGLFGVLVVDPLPAITQDQDATAAVHSYSGRRTINGRTGVSRLTAESGSTVRLRLVNTDNGRLRTWVTGGAYRVLAVDARDLNEPELVQEKQIVVPAGGRADLELTVPTDGSALRVDIGGGTALVVGPVGVEVDERPEPELVVDLLGYGTPAPLGFDPSQADREFDYDIGRRPGFLDGRPGLWWTVNGELLPDVPMYMVEEGDVVRMTIRNDSGDVHPMHLHGHHAVVLSRNGEAASGSPWRVDSLDVLDGEEYEIAFVADNPGVWMDHCHNLEHAAEGLMAHLAYAGVTTPYRMGSATGNEPE
jgi:FtsP/CotA-like multicopper oxidase with cupredoxin domain